MVGQDRLFNVSGTPVWDPAGNFLGALTILHDVTEHRRLEQVEHEARAEMEDRLATLQLILDELPSGAFLVCGHDARLVLANRTALAVLGAYWRPGQPMEEFLKQNGVGILTMDGHPLAFEQLAAITAVRRGETVRQFQSITRQPNGKTLSAMVNAVALDAHRLKLSQTEGPPAEEPAYVALVTYEDVTVLKEAERLKDEFIGIAAHELRNPLAVLKGYVQMLLLQTRRGKGPKLLPTQEEALQSIDRSTTELVEFTEDLLDVTRLQGGGWQLHPESTDLVALVERTVKRLQTTTRKHTLSFETTLPSLVVYADPGRIEQVLSNLIGNAIKYSPNGGPIEITLWEATGAQEARLSIRDYGIGIPEKDQARIFGHFARASNAGTYGISGTGFGLYLSHELVERHNGRIWFESKEGQGSTFFIALPHAS
jgi:signal transduction histidine kinase